MAKSYFRSSGAAASVGGYSAPSLSKTCKPNDIAALNQPASGVFMKVKSSSSHSIAGATAGSIVKPKAKPMIDKYAPVGSFLKHKKQTEPA